MEYRDDMALILHADRLPKCTSIDGRLMDHAFFAVDVLVTFKPESITPNIDIKIAPFAIGFFAEGLDYATAGGTP
jgi:hypothetical protein